LNLVISKLIAETLFPNP